MNDHTVREGVLGTRIAVVDPASLNAELAIAASEGARAKAEGPASFAAEVCSVADFPVIDDLVAALVFGLTGRAATITTVGVAIITLLIESYHRVTALH